MLLFYLKTSHWEDGTVNFDGEGKETDKFVFQFSGQSEGRLIIILKKDI